MRSLILLLITLTLFGNVSGQKIEFSASLNSGLYYFRNGIATGSTVLETDYYSSGLGLILDPYGNKGGLCYGASLNVKRVFNNKYFFGVDIGYEMLSSKVNVSSVFEVHQNANTSSTYTLTHNLTGNAFINNSFINAYPFVGYQCKYDKISFDLTVGADIGYYLKITESGNVKKPDGTNYNVYFDPISKYLDIDFRPRLQLTTSYKKFGVYVGYSYGIFRYASFSKSMASRVIRFGVTCKL